MLSKLYDGLHSFFTTTFNQLLVFLLLLFIFRPFGQGALYTGIWQLLFSAVVLMGIFNVYHSYKVKMLAVCFGVPSVVMSWSAMVYEDRMLITAYVLCTAIYIVIVLASIIQRVILNPLVTLETLRGVIVVYFLIAFAFAYLFYFTELVLPGSFHLLYEDESLFGHNRYLSEMMYFSFVTMLSIGYGDMTARGDLAQTFAVLEGIAGKFYVAILVSRLVSVYTYLAHQQEAIRKKARRITKSPNQPPPPV